FLSFNPGEITSVAEGDLGERALAASAYVPPSYAPEARHRIEIYRKLAQASEIVAVESFEREVRDRFGPPPEPVKLLIRVTELKIIAAERAVSTIEVKADKL